jgi:GTP-binding protein YchF
MSLSIGIIGLPNVGKSTLFNALTREQNAQAENYPFCTIEPNKAVVPVPDPRLESLRGLLGVDRAIPATIDFVDVAGLVEGASRGEGLGNQFLGNIRDVDAILHVVRCFDDPNVVHVRAQPDPALDIDIINTELALADLAQLERRIEKLSREVKGDRRLEPVLAMAQALVDYLSDGQPLWAYPARHEDAFIALNRELHFLTAKPVIYAANVDEDSLHEDNAYVASVRRIAAEQGAQMMRLNARLESDMAGLSDDERKEYLALYEIETSSLDSVIQSGYALLGLISYFSFNDDEVRAWTIHRGWTAPRAAGVIHTDFERGFIKAEVVPFDTFVSYGSRHAAREAGAVQIQGRDYVVQDGDVILFRFNV